MICFFINCIPLFRMYFERYFDKFFAFSLCCERLAFCLQGHMDGYSFGCCFTWMGIHLVVVF